ncbi:MAG: hypothetical protein RSF40_01325 [Oscillospiraceae bacterium]
MTNLKTAKLIQLIKDNPTLPVVPMINYDTCADDDCGYWLGSFGDCSVGKYATYRERFYTDEDELKEEYFNQHDEDYQGMSSDLIEADLGEKTKDMWIEAILVYIEP